MLWVLNGGIGLRGTGERGWDYAESRAHGKVC